MLAAVRAHTRHWRIGATPGLSDAVLERFESQPSFRRVLGAMLEAPPPQRTEARLGDAGGLGGVRLAAIGLVKELAAFRAACAPKAERRKPRPGQASAAAAAAAATAFALQVRCSTLYSTLYTPQLLSHAVLHLEYAEVRNPR